MSQTSSHGGPDPDRDEWLKQFRGLPEVSTDEELFTDRAAPEPVAKRRADAMTIEGEISSFGELARESKRIVLDAEARPGKRMASGLMLTLTLTPVFFIVAAIVLSLVFSVL